MVKMATLVNKSICKTRIGYIESVYIFDVNKIDVNKPLNVCFRTRMHNCDRKNFMAVSPSEN